VVHLLVAMGVLMIITEQYMAPTIKTSVAPLRELQVVSCHLSSRIAQLIKELHTLALSCLPCSLLENIEMLVEKGGWGGGELGLYVAKVWRKFGFSTLLFPFYGSSRAY